MKIIILITAAIVLCAPAWAFNCDMGLGTDPNTNGSDEHPWLIEDLDDFDIFADPNNAATYWAPGVHTKLMTHINLSGRTYTTAVIARVGVDSFKGVFNGNGLTISNLEIDAAVTNNHFLGLFGYADRGSVINKLGLENINIQTSGNCVGALCGANRASVQNCYSNGIIRSSGDYIGGLCGLNWEMTENCYSATSVEGGSYVGGGCGDNRGNIIGCYATGSVIGEEYVGGLTGRNFDTIINSYSTGSVMGDNRIGGLVGVADGICENSFWNVETSGQNGSRGGIGLITDQMKMLLIFQHSGWDNSDWVMADGIDWPRLSWEETDYTSIPPGQPIPLAGSGLESDPYQIWTVEEFALLGILDVFLDKHILLMENLNMTGVFLNRIGNNYPLSFRGVFDGGNHVISNVTIELPYDNRVALFSYVEAGGVVKNLGLEDVNMKGFNDVAGLVAKSDKGVVLDCYVKGVVNASGYDVGGLVGYNYYATVDRCYSDVVVSGSSDVGGLVGYNPSGIIGDSFSLGSTSGGYDIGGLVGRNTGTVETCYVTGSVQGNSAVGGLAGYNSQAIIGCYAAGPVVGNTDTGGIVGRNYEGSISYSFWDIDTSGMTIGYNLDSSYPGTILHVLGKTTAEMMTQSIFTSWDFDPADGDPADWMMLRAGEDYPRLAWQTVYTGDIAGLYGTDMVDVAYLARYWQLTDCNTGTDCGRADIDASGDVGLGDLVAVADDWLR